MSYLNTNIISYIFRQRHKNWLVTPEKCHASKSLQLRLIRSHRKRFNQIYNNWRSLSFIFIMTWFVWRCCRWLQISPWIRFWNTKTKKLKIVNGYSAVHSKLYIPDDEENKSLSHALFSYKLLNMFGCSERVSVLNFNISLYLLHSCRAQRNGCLNYPLYRYAITINKFRTQTICP